MWWGCIGARQVRPFLPVTVTVRVRTAGLDDEPDVLLDDELDVLPEAELSAGAVPPHAARTPSSPAAATTVAPRRPRCSARAAHRRPATGCGGAAGHRSGAGVMG